MNPYHLDALVWMLEAAGLFMAALAVIAAIAYWLFRD